MGENGSNVVGTAYDPFKECSEVASDVEGNPKRPNRNKSGQSV